MTTKKLTKDTEKSNRQWAWQFLRRNRGYREAYDFLCALTEEQQYILVKLMNGALISYSENWNKLGSLPTKLFDRMYLLGCKERHVTLDDFIREQKRPYSKAKQSAQQLAEEMDDLVLRVASEFRVGHYGLHQWIDPDIDQMSAGEGDKLWSYEVPIEASLVRSPHLDNAGISFEKSEWQGVSLSKLAGNQSKEKNEPPKAEQSKKRPVQAEVLPLKMGVNGAVFTMNDFANPASSYSTDGHRIAIGTDPEPLSLDGDTLVRATFDLSLPIDYQLDSVKAFLTSHQKELQEAGFISELPSRKGRQGVFAAYIAILDFHEQGLSDFEIAKKLKNLDDETYTDSQGKEIKSYVDPKKPERVTPQEHTNTLRKQLERARYLRDHGYRSLALQLE